MADLLSSMLNWQQPNNNGNPSYGVMASDGIGASAPSVPAKGQETNTGGYDPFSWEGLLGGKQAGGTTVNGWGGTAVGVGQGLLNAFMGMKQYGLMEDQLNESKRQFDANFGAQKKLTNSRLEDRQRARRAANPGAYQSVGAYMKENGV